VGFGTFGGPHILALLTEVSTRALKAVWYQKWLVHRRLRPEEFGGREGPEGGEQAGKGGAGNASGKNSVGQLSSDDMPEPSEDASKPLTDDPAAPPKKRAKSPETAGREEVIDLLKRMQRGETIDEKQLVERGWSPQRAAAFVRDLKRLAERVDAAERKSRGAIEHGAELGERAPRQGGRVSDDASLRRDSDSARDDAKERSGPNVAPRVPAHLKPLLEAYFRSMAGRQAESQPAR
jgi:hypothetical protein